MGHRLHGPLLITRSVKVRRQALQQWRPGTVIHRGTGVICLFYGEPGTGKTLSAEVIATETGLSLRHINVGAIVDNAAMRERIWRMHLPPTVPLTADLDKAARGFGLVRRADLPGRRHLEKLTVATCRRARSWR